MLLVLPYFKMLLKVPASNDQVRVLLSQVHLLVRWRSTSSQGFVLAKVARRGWWLVEHPSVVSQQSITRSQFIQCSVGPTPHLSHSNRHDIPRIICRPNQEQSR
jgi:hypothetical protein